MYSDGFKLILSCSIRKIVKDFIRVQEKEKKVIVGLLFTSSVKREIRHAQFSARGSHAVTAK